MKSQEPQKTDDVLSLQERLWNEIHGRQEWEILNFTPNSLAVEVQKIFPPSANILEVGCSNGRDARHFASHGHSVVAIDFSEVALGQMMILAKQQGCDSRITPIHHNIAKGLPTVTGPFDCFYSRSSLHIDDDAMIILFSGITPLLKNGGLIAIEGRTDEDDPIQESEKVEKGLAINWRERGHIRRVWTREFCLKLAKMFSWIPMILIEHEENIGNKKNLLRFIAKTSI